MKSNIEDTIIEQFELASDVQKSIDKEKMTKVLMAREIVRCHNRLNISLCSTQYKDCPNTISQIPLGIAVLIPDEIDRLNAEISEQKDLMDQIEEVQTLRKSNELLKQSLSISNDALNSSVSKSVISKSLNSIEAYVHDMLTARNVTPDQYVNGLLTLQTIINNTKSYVEKADSLNTK